MSNHFVVRIVVDAPSYVNHLWLFMIHGVTWSNSRRVELPQIPPDSKHLLFVVKINIIDNCAHSYVHTLLVASTFILYSCQTFE